VEGFGVCGDGRHPLPGTLRHSGPASGLSFQVNQLGPGSCSLFARQWQSGQELLFATETTHRPATEVLGLGCIESTQVRHGFFEALGLRRKDRFEFQGLSITLSAGPPLRHCGVAYSRAYIVCTSGSFKTFLSSPMCGELAVERIQHIKNSQRPEYGLDMSHF